MRICHLAASHSTFSGRLFHREALSARQSSIEVTIIAAADPFAVPADHGCRIVPIPVSSRVGKLRSAWQLFCLGRAEQADVYHCHDLASLTSGALLKLLRGRALIYDAHEDYPLTYSSNLTRNRALRGTLRAAFLLYEWLLLRAADEVFTVDPLIARKFNQMGKRALVLPNFPRLRTRATGAATPPDCAGRHTFVYAGSLSRRVAVCEMLSAIERLRHRFPDVLLLLVGEFCDPPYREQVERLIEEHGLQDWVRILGEVPVHAVPRLLRHCFAGLVLYAPSDNYGDRALYVVKMMEYMAAGLPIIASSFRGLSMVLRHRGCGMTADPRSAPEIASAMAILLSDHSLAQRLGAASRRAFEARYHWEAVETKLLSAYRRLAVRGSSQ